MKNLSEMMKKITLDQIAKIKGFKTTEKFLTSAKADGFEITSEEAEELVRMLFPLNGEISDEEIGIVAGGLGGPPLSSLASCPDCEKRGHHA